MYPSRNCRRKQLCHRHEPPGTRCCCASVAAGSARLLIGCGPLMVGLLTGPMATRCTLSAPMSLMQVTAGEIGGLSMSKTSAGLSPPCFPVCRQCHRGHSDCHAQSSVAAMSNHESAMLNHESLQCLIMGQ